MANYKQAFMDYMDANGIKYTDLREHLIKVVYNGDNLRSIPVYVVFDDDGDNFVQFRCWEVAHFKNKEAKALVACNELNNTYRWVKFYLDKDADIVVECDARVDMATCGEECLFMVRRVVNITDDAYPVIGKYLWGG